MKLIAVDLDGTLFGINHDISPRTSSVLHEVASHGYGIVVVTGRSAHSAIPRLDLASSDTIAFGDNLNDLPMLNWAGESVAMGNAMDEVKAIATSGTSSNIDHGVAEMLGKKIMRGEL